ncbi:PAS domain S-box-containing protein [Motilibacter rhizosphaerae]|uniref:PAS domain S-box-containing protein n=1 Tax=Motilibacter rhizosphaerae TaxID=598652 RepID=A0A4Q7NV35_9ACTN|nr:SpoIIE family protein phosphatase [Motilibacter rhizosphaerae]RZS91106.1 PAS domain S-box-containing protein [Motilibacter rhizosphaerae]
MAHGAPGTAVPEQAADRVAFELAVDAAGVGTFDWDLRTGALTWDDRLLELFGLDRATFGGTIEAFNATLHPDDLARVTAALQGAIATCGDYAAEYRVVLPGGRTRWVAARGRALCDASGTAVRVVGAAYDTTAARDADARVARVLESMNAAFFLLDREWRFAYVNGHAERLLGMTREAMLGGVVWELFPYAVGSEFEERYRGAVESGRPATFEAYYPPPLDSWYEVQAWPDPDGLSVYFLDITARRAAQDQARRAAERAHLLAETTSALTSTHDADEAVARLAELVVPVLGDWCIVSLVDDDERAPSPRGLRDVGLAHVDPERLPVLRRYAGARLTAFTDDAYVRRVLRTGGPALVRRDGTAALQRVLLPGPAQELAAELAPESFVVLPLRGRGRTVGLLSLFNGPDRGPLDEEDLDTLRELAGRAGLALDSGRLYRQQRDLAEALQRSLLTEPPEPDHVQVIVRYLPAAEAAQVGGDWYDAFFQRHGSTVLVIGDVIGHDTAAAAAMGQVRTVLRAIAVTTGAGPAGVLADVDAAMRTLALEVTATAVVARVEQTPEEREEGVSRLRWSNAGHPPPMVVLPDRSVLVLEDGDPDLLLGIDSGSPRGEHVVTVERGATVLLYTDGLVERRGQSLDDGLSRLQEVLAELAAQDLDLDGLCDQVLARLVPGRAEDDVALVAVRLHPQDRPRPPEAGPNRYPEDIEPERA